MRGESDSIVWQHLRNTMSLQSSSPSRLAQAKKWVPGLRALVAGLVLCALLVPQGMAYAELAGLPPITGLYTTVVCLVAYAVFGPCLLPWNFLELQKNRD